MTEGLQGKELTDIKYLRSRMTGNVGLALDHAYNLGFFDGEKNVVEKIRAEIEARLCDVVSGYTDGYRTAIQGALAILDKYKAESEER